MMYADDGSGRVCCKCRQLSPLGRRCLSARASEERRGGRSLRRLNGTCAAPIRPADQSIGLEASESPQRALSWKTIDPYGGQLKRLKSFARLASKHTHTFSFHIQRERTSARARRLKAAPDIDINLALNFYNRRLHTVGTNRRPADCRASIT